MSKYGVLVMGPAGAGKSTFCTSLITHLHQSKRSAIYINLDPAATSFGYTPSWNITDWISLDDAMSELTLGPNGGLVYCFEWLLENLEVLTDALVDVGEEYLVIFDLPGQIELYTHIPVVPRMVKELGLQGLGMNLCAAYLMEGTFMVDKGKFFSGALSAMSAMLLIELPHVNVLSKMDLVRRQVSRRDLGRFLGADAELLDEEDGVGFGGRNTVHLTKGDEPLGDGRFAGGEEGEDEDGGGNVGGRESVMQGKSFERLNRAVARLVDDYGMVNFLRLDASDEDSVAGVLSHIDDCIQFHEAQEPREPMDVE
ncbi:MAG: ATP binding protein [Chrysothrix sp. TS-e1954]|nr:MAG: ATP binding protein [Chrysothrix sp. TS-e1954]